ncbi:Nucleotide-binding alpha-beta plait [Penicillium bovifimosum]|uniref:Nucleotide-binding alpha-beta plait n=1 Tax=Penicillium bovifimosum TaxID=126998 RepID=A0A9W9GK18_9EURO|nr:Nucleotide-binding alpha-beta plait [Penicillium bovifimosum]KAJ5121212.1 Nucleotide-binding alpha-beta plait [Penicillium bovifimosum]
MTESTRLHITPFTPEILPSVLPASVRSLATDISFHEITTFPENNYGYVTLPKMEAEKIKKKLNGSILKGKKFKVEAARPSKRHREEEDAVPEAPSSVKKKSKKSKKQEPENGVLDGFELPADRKVKRGWTETSDAKQERRKSEKKEKKDKEKKLQPKSKYTDKSECLFRATIPPNRASDLAPDDKKAKKKKALKDNVVHEFAKTVTQPSFLRTAEESAVPTATFEEGKGWIDSTGNVREPANEKISKDSYRPGKIPGAKEKRPTKSAAKETKKRPTKEVSPEVSSESEDYTSSSGSSSEEISVSESEVDEGKEDDAKTQLQQKTAKSESDSDADASTHDKTPNPSASAEMAIEPVQEVEPDTLVKEVHPLEALFKRAAPTASDDQLAPAAETGFSFFGNDIESEDEPQVAEPQTPFTPFTKNDLQNRGQRSAAPTPDTTAAARHMTWNESDGSDDDVMIDSPVTKSRLADGEEKEETEFAKWFWENRGENNRAWKKRRRDAAKEQRQRDNRKKGLKGKS